MNGRQRCDEIKAQLDTVSDQIKEAERAQHEQQHDMTAAAGTADPSSSSIEQSRDTDPGRRSGRSTKSVTPVALGRPSTSPARQPEDLAAKVPSGKPEKKRKRDAEKSPDPETDSRSRQEQEKKRHRAGERDGTKKATRELPVEKLPGSKNRKHTAGDKPANAARGGHSPASEEEAKAAPKEGDQAAQGPKDLPQLKKKRHLLYKQLQEARQQVPLLFY